MTNIINFIERKKQMEEENPKEIVRRVLIDASATSAGKGLECELYALQALDALEKLEVKNGQ